MTVSVYITSYNQRKYLREAIESVLAQTRMPDQIIIVDDCSTDGSQELISNYKRLYPEIFTTLYHKENTGVTQARIDALNAVTCDYVSYLDGDDRYLPVKLEKELAGLKASPEAKISCSNNVYISEDGKEYLYHWVDDEEVPVGDVFVQTFSRSYPKKSLFRMELVEYAAWEQIGFHDPDIHLYEDFDMRIRLTKQLKLVFVDEVLSEIREHDKGLSKSAFNRHFKFLLQIFRKNEILLSNLSSCQRFQAKLMLGKWISNIGFRASINYFHRGQIEKAVSIFVRALWMRFGRA
jgi:glycosyltransferase involved in cell wall biosynthesis